MIVFGPSSGSTQTWRCSFARHSKYRTSSVATTIDGSTTRLNTRSSSVSHTAVSPAAITVERPRNAITTARILDVLTCFPPFSACRCRYERTYGALDVNRGQLLLARRQFASGAVGDGPSSIDQDDQTVLAIEQLLDESMKALAAVSHGLSQRHSRSPRDDAASAVPIPEPITAYGFMSEHLLACLEPFISGNAWWRAA